MGFFGSGPLAGHIASSYRQDGRVVPQAWFHTDLDEARKWAAMHGCPVATSRIEPFLDCVDAVEMLGGAGLETLDAASRILMARKPLSLSTSLVNERSACEKLMEQARRSGAAVRVNDPVLFYPPYVKAKELLERREIGEIATVRIQANLSGMGHPDEFREILQKKPLQHPALDKFSIALFFAGEVEKVQAYLNPFVPEKGGQALVIWKSKTPGRYGIMELSYSPQVKIRFEYMPCHDVIEISGSDGILWVNHFHGKLTEEPSIVVRRAKTYYQIGIESGMKREWSDALQESAKHFVSSVIRKRPPRPSLADQLRAIEFRGLAGA